MLRQNLSILVRSLLRQKSNTLITLSGITLGLTAVFLAFIVIAEERNYDRFHTGADRIFRINKHYFDPSGDHSQNAETPGLMAAALESEFPEVQKAAHLAPWFDDVLVTYDRNSIRVENWVFADTSLFQAFDFEILKGGTPSQVLAKPGQVILTESLARALFGKQEPIGKSFIGLQERIYTVSGIVADAPRQSHIQYDLIASWSSTETNSGFHDFTFLNNWLGQTVYTYVLLRDPAQMATVNEKLPAFTAKYMPDRTGMYDFYLQPLTDIYLQSSDLLYLRGGKYGSATFQRTFFIIAILILIIACFNYINITTARAVQRTKEVGVKKVLGASHGQLVRQFLIESVGIALIAGVLAFTFAQVLLPQLNLWFEKDIPLYTATRPQSILFLLGLTTSAGVLSGIMPGLLFSRFKPIALLRGAMILPSRSEWPRQILITLQLTIGIGLIAGTLLLHNQFRYLLGRDLGFDKEQVLVMHTAPGIDSNATAFRQDLIALPGIQHVSMCQAAMPDGTFGTTVVPEGNHSAEFPVQLFRVDSNYLDTYGISVAEGRFLDRLSDVEAPAVVVNETFVRNMGWPQGVGKTVQFPGSDRRIPIVGVLKDFHFNSLHQAVSPILMYLDARKHNISVRLEPQRLASILPQIQALWKKYEGRYPFDYYFVDDHFAQKYYKEKQMVRIITVFAAVALFIACLGLYGLTSHAISRRRREISIRKVLGAGIGRLLALLTTRYFSLVLIALCIATPVAWYFMQKWLQNFTYHTRLTYWFFAIAGIAMTLIVLLTVSLQTIKAALSNPVRNLKAE